MYKRISTVVALGSSVLLILGLGTSLFLNHTLHQRVKDAEAAALLLSQTRVPMREAQIDYVTMGLDVSSLLLNPTPGSALGEKWRGKKQTDENATRHVAAALAATQSAELKETLRKLMAHDHEVTNPLEDEILRLATTDFEKAREIYRHKYLPAQEGNMALVNEALRLATAELDAFNRKANEAAASAQSLARIAIVLFCVIGGIAAIFLVRAVARLVRQFEKAARENKDLMEHSLEVICSINEAGCFVRVNGACERNWGYSAKELEGRPYIELVHPEDVEKTRQITAEIMAGRFTMSFKNRYIRKDGAVVYVRWSAHWLEDQKQMFCVAHDITESKRAEEALRASEARTRLIVATAHDAFIAIDTAGNVIEWNPQAEATFGWSSTEALGQPLHKMVIPSQFHEMHLHDIQHFLATGEAPNWNKRIEMPGLHRDGRELSLELTISPIRVGDTFLFSAFVREITERKRAEQELHQAKEAAEAATRAKSEFLANMSHEIRTPMNGVIGLTNLMLKTPLSGQQHEYMTLIKASADSLLRLLNDILDFSKMEARKLELDVIEFDLRESVGNTLKAFSASANEKGLELTYQVAPNVPRYFLGDPGRLAQIIVNLTGNALKFTKQGEVVVRVAQESHGIAGTVLRFSISDTGIGMTREQQAYIFNAFAQADGSTTRQYGGTGLGLAIVSQLIALMNGSIRVESEPGKGTTFHFTVRLGMPQRQPAPALQTDPAILKNMRVLVVDDNRTNRLILAEILTSWDMRPVLTENGEQALAEMQREVSCGTPFPLVLLDSQMPQFDGFELAQAIKSLPSLDSATIMMLSSSDLPGEIARCKALGITRFLRKPVKQSELFDAIVAAMGIASADTSRVAPEVRATPSKPARILNVLVAEDHPINQKLVTEILNERGHSFAIASNGIEALQLLDQQSFDVILMDGQMPEMDGYQATREIRRREQSTGKHIRIIAVTAHAMKQDREMCLAAGMDDYVSKPVDPDELLERLEGEHENFIERFSEHATTGIEKPTVSEAFDMDSALKRVRGKHALLKQLAHVFLQDLPNALAEIHTAVAANDASWLERSAHRLKGAAKILSAEPVADVAGKLEQFGRNNEFDQVQESVRELQARALELAAALEALTGDAT